MNKLPKTRQQIQTEVTVQLLNAFNLDTGANQTFLGVGMAKLVRQIAEERFNNQQAHLKNVQLRNVLDAKELAENKFLDVLEEVSQISSSTADACAKSSFALATNNRKSALLIISCKDPRRWYTNLVGKHVPFIDICAGEYKSKGPDGQVNFVQFEDAIPVMVSLGTAYF